MELSRGVFGSLEDLWKALKGCKRVAVTSHVNPDGDAVGSLLALGLVLEKAGHEVFFFHPDPIPEIFSTLPSCSRIQASWPASLQVDATMVVDVYSPDRTGLAKVSDAQRGKILVLDHHITDSAQGDACFIDPSAGASGILVRRFAAAGSVAVDRAIAENIYCGILTDTGSFHYSSATPEAFQMAGEMVSLGVEPWEFARKIYESQPLARLQLLAEVLSTLEVSSDGLFASVHVSQSTLKKHAAGPDLTDGFINYPRSIAGVEVAIFFRENPDGTVKASLRSAGTIDVQKICASMGGGGHRNAAGCTVSGPMAAARTQVFAATAASCNALKR